MIGLILTVIFGLGIAYFSTQNTGGITIKLYQYAWHNIPLYFVIVGSLLAGIVMASLISFVNNISSKMILRGKDSKIKETKQLVDTLTKNLHQLELENAALKANNNGESLDEDKSL